MTTTSGRAIERPAPAGPARLLVLARVILVLSLFMAAAGLVFNLIDLERFGGAGVKQDWLVSDLPIWIGFLVFPLVGYLLASRRPDHPIGWLLSAIGIAYAVDRLLDPYSRYAFHGGIGGPDLGTMAASLDGAGWVLPIGLTATFLILLFPTGHLPSPRWRWFARATAAEIALVYLWTLFQPGLLEGSGIPHLRNRIGVSWLGPLVPVGQALTALLPVAMVGSAVALVRRYRRSSGVERLQLRWLATAAGLAAALTAIALPIGVAVGWTGSRPGWVQAVEAVTILSFALIPAAIGVAILKYRLYDIDLVVNKAVVYGALAVFITAVYVAIVVGIGAAIGAAGRPNVGLSIAATAVVAFAFQPVRERVQHVANRLVYGRRAAPYEVLSELSNRMAGAYATEELLPRVARLLAEGTGARKAEVWLHVGDALVRQAVWPAEEGEPPSLPCPPDVFPDIAGAARVVEVRDEGEILGALALAKAPGEPLTPPEEKLAADLGRQAGLILRNVRLIEELRASRQRIVAAQDDERRRLERDIHDGAQQQIVALSLATRLAQTSLGPSAPPKALELLDRATEELKEALAELRELARGIHPRILTERGLAAAIQFLAERSPVPVTVHAEANGRLPDQIEATAYFAVSEALANVAKYSRATSATVSAERENGSLVVHVVDDGVGGADPSRGSGIRGLSDRVAAVGGRLEVDSPAGRGTRLTIRLPAG
jgi:signal transduction histidine kinase